MKVICARYQLGVREKVARAYDVLLIERSFLKFNNFQNQVMPRQHLIIFTFDRLADKRQKNHR